MTITAIAIQPPPERDNLVQHSAWNNPARHLKVTFLYYSQKLSVKECILHGLLKIDEFKKLYTNLFLL